MSSTTIPMLDLRAQYNTIRGEIDEAIKEIVESQSFILGPAVAEFEREIAAYTRCAFGVGVSSGTDALLLSLMVMGIGPGDEVVTTSYSFFATAGAIARMGAKPVFVDIDPRTYNINADQIAAKINKHTRAIIPVHLYGQVADMAPIMDIAESNNLTVIEDAAQAIGAEYHDARAGTLGQLGCFSFFPSKNLGGFGDGGMVITNDPAIDERLRLFRNHGHKPKYYNAVVGGNFRLDALQAAVLRVKLRHLDDWTSSRQKNASLYRQLFTKAKLATDINEFGRAKTGIVLPYESPDCRHIYNQFIIRCHRRSALMQFLRDKGISTEVYYPLPLHLQECFANLGYQHGDLPLSEAAAEQVLALPIYPELTEQMIQRVVETITDFYC